MGARSVAGAALVLLLFTTQGAHAQQRIHLGYGLRDLGVVSDMTGSALNANGSWAASCRQSNGSIQACGFYNQGTPPSNLRYNAPTDAFIESEARGINGAGFSVGSATTSAGTFGMEFIGPNTYRRLDPLSGFGGSSANDINLYGISVGSSFGGAISSVATQWTASAQDLTKTWPSYARVNASSATAINVHDTTAGWFTDPNRAGNITAWVMASDNVFHDNVAMSFRDSQVTDMNDEDVVVGFGTTLAGPVRGFAGCDGCTESQLAPLSGDTMTLAHGINNSFLAVGSSGGSGGWRAVMWNLAASAAPAPVDLNTQLHFLILTGYGYLLTGAVAVNDSGQILCEGFRTGSGSGDPPNTLRAFLLTPN